MFKQPAVDRRFALRFHLGSLPVAVSPSFFLVTVLLYWRRDLTSIVLGLGAVAVSILFHELGHAFAAWAFGVPSDITLHGFGGTTRYEDTIGRRGHILVSLAGPAAGFSLGALLYVSTPLWALVPWQPWMTLHEDLLWLNFVWGMVNLAPLPPLDGGHVLEHLLGPKRRLTVLTVAALTGLVGGALALMTGRPFIAWTAFSLGLVHGAAWLQEQRHIRFRRFLDGEKSRRRDIFWRWIGGDERPPVSRAVAPNATPADPRRAAPARPLASAPRIEAMIPVAVESAAQDYLEAKRLAQQGQTFEAAKRLHRAILGGFDDLEVLTSDPDLERVRQEPLISSLLDPLGLRRAKR